MGSGLIREESFEKSLQCDEREFVKEAFDVFDLNNVRKKMDERSFPAASHERFGRLSQDKVIELEEVEKAYAHNGASAEVIRLLEKYDLSTKPITSETIETFDLMRAVKRRACGTWDGGGVVTEEMFEKWIIGQVNKHNRS